MTGENVLYVGTATMVFFALTFILFVVWASGSLKKFKTFSEERDKYFMRRIDSIESLIKTEFLQVISSIKNL